MTIEANETATPSLVVTAPDGRRVAADTRGPDGAPVVLLLHPAPGISALDPEPLTEHRASAPAPVESPVRVVSHPATRHGQARNP